jgi:hypothetical protein
MWHPFPAWSLQQTWPRATPLGPSQTARWAPILVTVSVPRSVTATSAPASFTAKAASLPVGSTSRSASTRHKTRTSPSRRRDRLSTKRQRPVSRACKASDRHETWSAGATSIQGVMPTSLPCADSRRRAIACGIVDVRKQRRGACLPRQRLGQDPLVCPWPGCPASPPQADDAATRRSATSFGDPPVPRLASHIVSIRDSPLPEPRVTPAAGRIRRCASGREAPMNASTKRRRAPTRPRAGLSSSGSVDRTV